MDWFEELTDSDCVSQPKGRDYYDICPCGHGKVVQHEDAYGALTEEIECPTCKQKYYVAYEILEEKAKDQIHYEYLNGGIYLIPNGLKLQEAPARFYRRMPVDVMIRYKYHGDIFKHILDDFRKSKSMKDIRMTESRAIMREYKSEFQSSSVKKVRALLEDMEQHPDVYAKKEREFFSQWDEQKQERNKIRQHNKQVLSQSFPLHFREIG